MADTMTSFFSELAKMPAWTEMKPDQRPREVCRDIASFLRTNPDAWCKGVLARGGDNEPLSSPDDPCARKWCAIGLIARFTGNNRSLLERTMHQCSRAITPPNSVPIRLELYNDSEETKLEDVIAMFECAALLPRSYDEVKDSEEKQFPPPTLYGFGEVTANILNSAFAELDTVSASKIETPPKAPKIEIAKSSMLTEAALEKVMDEIEQQQKKLTPWSKIMAQIKGEAVAA